MSARAREVAELQRALGAGRASLLRALEALAEAGLAARSRAARSPDERNRPEWGATETGRATGELCARLLADARHHDLLLRKWSVPTLGALDEPRRFSELREALRPVTPRALAIALKDLEAGGLVEREVVPGYPPTTAYRTTARGAWLRRDL